MKRLTGNCEDDCQEACAYPGQFSECALAWVADEIRFAIGTFAPAAPTPEAEKETT